MRQVTVPDETSYSVFIPKSIAADHSRVVQLLNATCGRDDTVYRAAAADGPNTAADQSLYNAGDSMYSTGGSGYLVRVRVSKSEDDDSSIVWHGTEVKIDLTGDTAIAVSHMEVSCSCFTIRVNE